ncbi:hypothetical protein [Clostridium tyrobutyricum]|uniref:hypothetical protein n=1 Tax=Clostridium tyrobutyricum TaxID=1519 RepID=UPI001C381ADF|nr:hypothetical protein [Clostridium tyrobutyricum]MBV4427519.1 hypothetical protein [Clostridium tyrobutyricum]MBV4442744.1 hypothetical protein [Clostridium tyrobutyricum]
MKTLVKKENVWKIENGEIRKPKMNNIIMMALFIGIGVVVGTFGSMVVPLGFVSAFWPGQAIQSVGCIWFGMWGGIASVIFPMISNAIAGSASLPISIAYLPGNFLQGMIAGIAFRVFKADPRLKSGKDWIIYTIFGVIICNAIGAAWGSTVLRMFKLISPASHLTVFLGWAIGNSVPSFILGAILLKFVSPIIMRSRSFVKKYLA